MHEWRIQDFPLTRKDLTAKIYCNVHEICVNFGPWPERPAYYVVVYCSALANVMHS